MIEYANIGVMLLVASVIAGSILGISFLVGPRNPNPKKSRPYECGIDDIAPMPSRVSIRFLQVAMLFLIFDIEAVALFPLASILKPLSDAGVQASASGVSDGVFLLGEVGAFVALIIVGYLYVWKKGAFKWTA